MPQTTPEQRSRWPGSDSEAIKFLENRGYKLTKQWLWIFPEDRTPTIRELDAISYLIHEWDFGLANDKYTQYIWSLAWDESKEPLSDEPYEVNND